MVFNENRFNPRPGVATCDGVDRNCGIYYTPIVSVLNAAVIAFELACERSILVAPTNAFAVFLLCLKDNDVSEPYGTRFSIRTWPGFLMIYLWTYTV